MLAHKILSSIFFRLILFLILSFVHSHSIHFCIFIRTGSANFSKDKWKYKKWFEEWKKKTNYFITFAQIVVISFLFYLEVTMKYVAEKW